MAENYLTRTTFRAAPNHAAAVIEMAPVAARAASEYHGGVNPGPAAGEVTVLLYVSADSTLGAAVAAIGVIQRAFQDAGKPLPGRLSPAHVEAFKGDPPDFP